MINRTSLVSQSNPKRYKHPKNKQFTLNSKLQTYQIWTNNDQMPILCLSYFITTVTTPLLKQTQKRKLHNRINASSHATFFVTDHVDGLH